MIGLVLVGAGLYAVGVARSEWRGTGGADPYRAPEWWPLDLPAWRALIRAGPAGAVEAVLFGARYLVSLPENSSVGSALGVLLQVLILLTLAVMVLVGLYNRPGWAVAPRLRHFPGAIDEWNGHEPPPASKPASGPR